MRGPRAWFFPLVLAGAVMLWTGPEETLDRRFYYSAAEARSFLLSLGEKQRLHYSRHELLDFIFLFSYSGLAVSLWRRLSPPGKSFLAALVPGVLDFAETAAIFTALVTLRPESLPAFLGTVTALKWSGGILVLASLAWLSLSSRRGART